MNLAAQWNGAVTPPDKAAMADARRRWDALAKPLGSLGLLEEALVAIAGAQGAAKPTFSPRRLLVLCSDNGVTAQGVAGTPPAVTRIMAGFIAEKRSAAGVMATSTHTDLLAVDVGMFAPAEGVLDRRIAPGTKDFTKGPAMTRAQALTALETGIGLAKESAAAGYRLLVTGEMGIGNTTTSTALAAVLLGLAPEAITGPGVGLDPAGLIRKQNAVKTGVLVNKPDPADPLDVLHKLGGFDLAAMAGVFIGGAMARTPVVMDGYISAVAALTACRLCPAIRPYLLGSHLSAEPGARAVLDELGVVPLLHGGFRLGEGTGALALLPLLDLALAVYGGMIPYSELGL